MFNLPLSFKSTASATGNFSDNWKINSINQTANCDIPSEFGGANDGFSPEDLFLHSLINCFVGTFKVYAKGSKVIFNNIIVNGELILQKNSEGKVCADEVVLDIRIDGADREDRIQTLVAKTLKDGFILNSVKTKIGYNLKVN